KSMTKIRCTLPNASEEMNGVKFAVDAGGGVVSVDAVPDDLAAIFLSVPGFTAEGGKAENEDDPEAAAEAQRIKAQKAADAKDKKAAGKAAGKPAKAAKAAKPDAETPPAETPPAEGTTDGEPSTEGTDTTKPADENGEQEGEE
uniref:hypothetical protein n=1 Tax=Pseudomonas sp. TaxID=306 RepID=UPI00258E779D